MNISVSVYARMPILDMNIDETMYERGVKDLWNPPKMQIRKWRHTFSLYSAIKRHVLPSLGTPKKRMWGFRERTAFVTWTTFLRSKLHPFESTFDQWTRRAY